MTRLKMLWVTENATDDQLGLVKPARLLRLDEATYDVTDEDDDATADERR